MTFAHTMCLHSQSTCYTYISVVIDMLTPSFKVLRESNRNGHVPPSLTSLSSHLICVRYMTYWHESFGTASMVLSYFSLVQTQSLIALDVSQRCLALCARAVYSDCHVRPPRRRCCVLEFAPGNVHHVPCCQSWVGECADRNACYLFFVTNDNSD